MQPLTSYYELTAAFASAVDMVNYLLKNHHRRTAILAWHLGTALHLKDDAMADLCMAAALHDVGALTISERNALIQLDVEQPEPHAILGAAMLEDLPNFKRVSCIVRHHHARFDKAHAETPFESFVLHLADRIEILYNASEHYLHQVDSISQVISALSGELFHPEVVEAFFTIAHKDVLWLDLEHMSLNALLEKVLEHKSPIALTMEVLEGIALTFSKVIDYRSAFTATHSRGVGAIAYHLATYSGLDHQTAQRIKIAGYLHDIGKLGIPTEIIEKKSELDETEYSDIKAHSYFTHVILSEIPGISDIAHWASSHHEKRDGTGYPYHLEHNALSIETDILSFADLFTALSENRPYRDPMHKDEVLRIIMLELVSTENMQMYELIEEHYDLLDQERAAVQEQAHNEYYAIYSYNRRSTCAPN